MHPASVPVVARTMMQDALTVRVKAAYAVLMQAAATSDGTPIVVHWPAAESAHPPADVRPRAGIVAAPITLEGATTPSNAPHVCAQRMRAAVMCHGTPVVLILQEETAWMTADAREAVVVHTTLQAVLIQLARIVCVQETLSAVKWLGSSIALKPHKGSAPTLVAALLKRE